MRTIPTARDITSASNLLFEAVVVAEILVTMRVKRKQ